MFTYQSGEPLAASKRKTSLRSSARKEWPFLTPLDLTMISSEPQLATMVKDRSGRTMCEADIMVRNWMERQKITPRLSAPLPSLPPELAWENEGGAA